MLRPIPNATEHRLSGRIPEYFVPVLGYVRTAPPFTLWPDDTTPRTAAPLRFIPASGRYGSLFVRAGRIA